MPAYTQWREPCGLSPITTWNDLERVVGPQSALRIQSGYKSVEDIDLFVGGLAERPVVGGLVGPVFACIIAQQFSNLRKGDRFWYENGAFESSFTPAQLQSIRQVSFAQVICRTVGGGTLQPHVFLPHTVPTNERMPCAIGSLAPIDLMPWLERDPFIKDLQHGTLSIKNLTSQNNENTDASEMKLNKAFVDNKLDLKPPLDKINNKINDKINMPASHINSKRKNNRKTLRRPNTTQRRTTTRPTRRIATKRKHKRDVKQNDKARGAIYIKIDRPTSGEQSTKKASISNKQHYDQNKSDREYIILTPEQTSYDIEIKIKPSKKRAQSANIQKIVSVQQASNAYLDTFDEDETTTKRPQHFYNVPQPALADEGQYVDATSRPHFHGIITRRTTVASDDDITVRPYYTTKQPAYIYETTQDDDENRPFYNYPTVQQTDQSSYYATQSDSTNQQDDFAAAIIQNANTKKPYHSVPLYQTNSANRPNYRPILNDDRPQKPSYSYRPATQTYGSKPIYLDDFETTPLPIRLTTTYSYANTIKLQNSNAGYGGYQDSTSNRPHDLMTFYSVMTTKQRKRTKPTKPMTYNQPDDDNEDDDDDDDDNDTTWNPTSVISNIVNTFSDYFGSVTTTRKPYIQHDDDVADDFYTYPTFPQQGFLYSRQKDGQTVDANMPHTTTTTVTNIKRRYDTTYTEDIDYETMTYRAAHKEQYNADVTEENLSIAFDRDGYLRPEYMKYEGLKQEDRNYTSAINNNVTQTIRDETLRRSKQFTVPSNADQSWRRQIGLVSLKVLTKPER